MNLIKTHLVKLVASTKEETNSLNKVINDPKKVNRIIAVGIANYVAFKVLDVPTDPETILRQYYNNNLHSIVMEVVSAINEVVIIDYKYTSELVWEMWYQRALFVSGKLMPQTILKFLAEAPSLNNANKTAVLERLESSTTKS